MSLLPRVEWRQSGTPRPKNSRVQKSAQIFSPRFFGIQKASSSLIIFERAKLSTLTITHACCCNWRIFWWKTPREVQQGNLVLSLKSTGSPDNCKREETGLPGLPTSWSPTLFNVSASSNYHLFSGLKKQLKNAIFRPTRRSFLLLRPGWTDKILNFFSRLQT
jgi:hypothetical protein